MLTHACLYLSSRIAWAVWLVVYFPVRWVHASTALRAAILPTVPTLLPLQNFGYIIPTNTGVLVPISGRSTHVVHYIPLRILPPAELEHSVVDRTRTHEPTAFHY